MVDVDGKNFQRLLIPQNFYRGAIYYFRNSAKSPAEVCEETNSALSC